MNVQCAKCKEERKITDFLMHSEKCYKCVYEEKLRNCKDKGMPTICKMCLQPCAANRWVYCSKECADNGKMQQKKDYWTMKVKSL